jgi:hypothetical protein
MSNRFKIGIGDVGISIHWDGQRDDWDIGPSYRPFFGNGQTDITLRLHRGTRRVPYAEKVFECPPIWTLYRHNGSSILEVFGDPAFSGPEAILVLDPRVDRADLYLAKPPPSLVDPFCGPAMELLMVNYLAQGRGAILHACGIELNGKGVLFVGESGAGKSTLARIFEKEKHVEVLSDDRVIVRKKKSEFWIFGTPWHGEAGFTSPRGVRLERILFLKHGPDNTITETEGVNPVSKLLTCSFSTFWDSKAMAFTLNMLSDLASRVPSQVLTFRPDRTVLDSVKRICR